MKIYISADIEGVTGLVSWSQCGRPSGDHYDYRWARERMIADVNAAVRGARSAGATDILVKDSHGNSKNLILSDLEPGVELVSGHGSGNDGMMQGIDGSFHAAMLIGYHAMAGTQGGIMEHTISGRVHRMRINGMPAGEMAMSAGVAGRYGVPIVAVSSDRAGCVEAQALVPGVQAAEVKEGYGRYMGCCLPVEEAESLIEQTAAEGVRRAKAIQPWTTNSPVTFEIEFNRSEEADMAAKLVGCVRQDAYTVSYTGPDYETAHTAAWNLIQLAGLGPQAHD
ncbi:MAG: M55 family metallopeptidase [Fimbriimonadaceae bacterium]|nr:M55 family metallopeptidase [Fimbriimonadaceae bacterium]